MIYTIKIETGEEDGEFWEVQPTYMCGQNWPHWKGDNWRKRKEKGTESCATWGKNAANRGDIKPWGGLFRYTRLVCSNNSKEAHRSEMSKGKRVGDKSSCRRGESETSSVEWHKDSDGVLYRIVQMQYKLWVALEPVLKSGELFFTFLMILFYVSLPQDLVPVHGQHHVFIQYTLWNW